FAGTSFGSQMEIDCSKAISCHRADKWGRPFAFCTDGTVEEMCLLAPPSTGYDFICACNVGCSVPDNKLDNETLTCKDMGSK
ncbi:MAG: hypothetical protein ACXVCA_12280, partial [Bdellovibrio sp.]